MSWRRRSGAKVALAVVDADRCSVRPVSVYSMRMARVNVYVPDELAERARAAGLNISGVTQDALREALAANETDRWLERLDRLSRVEIAHERVMHALEAARDELGATT